MRALGRWEKSTATFQLNLPRVKVKGGKVGHILINGERIASLHSLSWNYGATACHAADGRGWRDPTPATPDDPTCRSCLRAMKFLGIKEITT